MEVLKNLVIDFGLFSGIEGFIFCLFFEKIGKCRKFKWYEWFILSVGNCLISKLLPPMIYQIVCVLWMSLLLYLMNKSKIIKCIKIATFSILCFFVYEVLYSIILLYIFNFDGLQRNLDSVNTIKLFLFMLPLRIIEIISIIIYAKRGDK